MRLLLALFCLSFSPCWGTVDRTLAELPVLFEPNQGQWAQGVEFGAHIGGRQYTFGRREIVIDGAIHLDLISTSTGARFEALDPVESKTNYLNGRDSHKWLIGVRNYARIRCRNAFPGIDLILYGSRGQLEFDYIVAPGANPDLIRFRVRGASLQDSAGNLKLIGSSGETVELHAPIAYQETRTGRVAVECRLRAPRLNEIAFATSGFNALLPGDRPHPDLSRRHRRNGLLFDGIPNGD